MYVYPDKSYFIGYYSNDRQDGLGVHVWPLRAPARPSNMEDTHFGTGPHGE